ncbi:Do family serine endopeptidase [Desertibaculum subflavum]|uniref:Do family serine endopeptidase n=1 Tax=Desertibaculum subflavum TaxID=2268458 RepID=UPI0034D1E3EE
MVPTSRAEIQASFAPLVKQVSPTVVNIYTRTVVQQQARSPLFDDPFFRRFFGDQLGGATRERVQRSLGSGVIADPRGYVVTNNHVVAGAQEITVVLHDRREFEAELILADERTDLAVLKIDPAGAPLPALGFGDSDELEVGDLVLAIGNPFGVGQTVTSGIVSALGRTMVGDADTQSFIQTDAAINPGNSGGALITMDGRLAGINTAIFSRSGGSLGIGFAIPSNLVASVLHAATLGTGVVRPWTGATFQAVTAEIAQSLGFDRPVGVIVRAVYPKGPADRAGIRVGDVITSVDGREVLDPRMLKFRIATKPVGQTAQVEIRRAGAARTVRFPLEAAPENPPRDETLIKGNIPLAGATVANLSPAVAEETGMPPDATGVVITGVARGSPAERLRLRPRDLVLAIDGQDVKRVSDLTGLLANHQGGWRIAVQRGEQTVNLVIR